MGATYHVTSFSQHFWLVFCGSIFTVSVSTLGVHPTTRFLVLPGNVGGQSLVASSVLVGGWSR
ncbi:MAG: hypothetical protein DRO11_06495 [Methanobacteriota archaeon]|nr:MAG: hypothetical protein DRO11_06495 [Euryarchaeota archaeon]